MVKSIIQPRNNVTFRSNQKIVRHLYITSKQVVNASLANSVSQVVTSERPSHVRHVILAQCISPVLVYAKSALLLELEASSRRARHVRHVQMAFCTIQSPKSAIRELNLNPAMNLYSTSLKLVDARSAKPQQQVAMSRSMKHVRNAQQVNYMTKLLKNATHLTSLKIVLELNISSKRLAYVRNVKALKQVDIIKTVSHARHARMVKIIIQPLNYASYQ